MKKLNPVLKLTMSVCAVSLALVGCGGSGGDSSGSDTPSEDSALIIGSLSGDAAADSTTEEIQLAAATRATKGLGSNLSTLQILGDSALQNLNDDGSTQTVVGDIDTSAIGELNSSTSSFLNSSLGVDDPLAIVSRSGDVITIDPDEASLCAEEFPLLETLNDDAARCTQLAADLIVEINAQTDETGVITYLFQNEPVLLIGYSPMGASYELRLSAVQGIIQRTAQLSGSSAELPVDLAGAIKFSGSIANDEPGSESGELALEVTEALSLAPTDGSPTRFSLEPSTVLRISSDAATGDVQTTVNWGALQLITEAGEADSNGNSSTTLTDFYLGGLSSTTTINTNQPAISISNLGLGGVPLTVTINEVESLNLDFGTLGISLDNETGLFRFDGALSAVLTIDNMMGILGDLGPEVTASLGISAPAGTTLSGQQNGAAQVGGTGPITLSATGASNSESIQQTLTINQGECFDRVSGIDITVVSCE